MYPGQSCMNTCPRARNQTSRGALLGFCAHLLLSMIRRNAGQRGDVEVVVVEGCRSEEHFILVDDSSFPVEVRALQGSEVDVLCGEPAFD
jgi:hypothetical protein